MSGTIKQSTRSLARRQRFEFWQNAVLPHVDLALRTDRDDFACEGLVSAVPQSIAIDAQCSIRLARRRKHIAGDAIDYIGFGTLLQGSGAQSQGDRDIAFASGDLFIGEMGFPCEIATGATYRETRININCALFEARLRPASTVRGLHLAADAPLVALFTAYLVAYAEAVPTMRLEEVGTGLDGVLHLLAGLIRSAKRGVAAEALTPAAIRDLTRGSRKQPKRKDERRS